MMNSNDPRLTAYVLGELDEAEQAEVERALAASPALQSEVESIRQAAALFDSSLQADAGPALTDEQRQAIQQQASGRSVELAERSTASKRGRWQRYAITVATTGIVASLLTVLLWPTIYRSPSDSQRSVSQAMAPANESSSSTHDSSGRDDDAKDADASTASAPALADFDSLTELIVEEVEPDSWESDGQPAAPTTELGLGFDERSFGGRAPAFGGFEGASAGESSAGYGAGAAAGMRGSAMMSDESGNLAPGASSMEGMTVGGGVSDSMSSMMGGLPAERRVPSDELASEAFAFNDRRVRSNAGPIVDAPAIRRVESESTSAPDPAPVERGRLFAGKGMLPNSNRSQQAVEEILEILEMLENAPNQRQAARPVLNGMESKAIQGIPAADLLSKDLSESVPESGLNVEARRQHAKENLAAAVEAERLLKQSMGDLGLRVSANEVSEETRQKLDELARLNAVKERAASELQRTWRRAQATPNASRLVIGDRDELLLEGMQANVMVDGFRARVLLDLYYFNNRGRQLEGNFKLRLPDDASLYYFAFGQSTFEYQPQVDQLADRGFLNSESARTAELNPAGILEAREGSWTQVKEARVVPREKAAHAYSETVRRRVDPALVEWSGAGMFNARVFPLMPNKLHRIVVGYDVNLQQVGEDLVYQLDLPADVTQCMVDLNVSALPGTTADIQPTTRPFVSGGRAFYHFDEVRDDRIELRFSGTGPMLLKGRDPQAGDFFAARVTPKLPEGEMQSGAERATFLVDTSLSSRPDKFNIWLNLMEAMLTRNRDTMKRFSVLFFNIDSHWWRDADVENTPENVDALMTYCHSLALEGATDLGQALREAASPSWIKAGEDKGTPRDFFLLSDGAVTWGEMNVHPLSETFTAGQTLFAYKTGIAGTSTATLEHLARQTGGAVFSIVNEDEVATAATAHRNRPWKLVDVSMAGGSDLLVAGRPQSIYPGQPLLIVGRGEPDAEVMLKVARGDEVMDLAVNFERVVRSELAARAYGQVVVGQLEDLGSALEDVSVAYARHFRVTGQTCSLLMLDREADYQRFNIKPEDDLFVVRSTPSADLIAKKLDELKEQLGDAKASVVAWLDKLQQTAGFQLQLPTALRLVIDRLPPDAFDVEPPRLVCKSHERGELAKEFIQQLDSGKLQYDSVTAQAASHYEKHGAADGLRTLSSLIEQNPGDPVLTRDVAYSAIEWGLGGQAYPLLRRVASLRAYEPQSYIAMAQCLAEIDHADLAMIYYEVALNARWHDRYKDIRSIAGVEYLRLLRRIERGELSSRAPEYAKARLESLAGQTPINEADLVVTMMWNTDRTDVDLHVLEPTGEECFYNHPSTRIGGKVTRDVTEGLGPEMYTLPKAKPGSYKIMANYFGSDANRTNVRTKVYITVYKNFGAKQEQVKKKTITLSDQKEKRELATVTLNK